MAPIATIERHEEDENDLETDDPAPLTQPVEPPRPPEPVKAPIPGLKTGIRTVGGKYVNELRLQGTDADPTAARVDNLYPTHLHQCPFTSAEGVGCDFTSSNPAQVKDHLTSFHGYQEVPLDFVNSMSYAPFRGSGSFFRSRHLFLTEFSCGKFNSHVELLFNVVPTDPAAEARDVLEKLRSLTDGATLLDVNTDGKGKIQQTVKQIKDRFEAGQLDGTFEKFCQHNTLVHFLGACYVPDPANTPDKRGFQEGVLGYMKQAIDRWKAAMEASDEKERKNARAQITERLCVLVNIYIAIEAHMIDAYNVGLLELLWALQEGNSHIALCLASIIQRPHSQYGSLVGNIAELELYTKYRIDPWVVEVLRNHMLIGVRRYDILKRTIDNRPAGLLPPASVITSLRTMWIDMMKKELGVETKVIGDRIEWTGLDPVAGLGSWKNLPSISSLQISDACYF